MDDANIDVLVVASQRGLRRALFDALDHEGHARIFSARDASHAAILLKGRTPLGLAVVAFEGDGCAALADCKQLRAIPACCDAALLAVFAEDCTAAPGQLPADVSDWLHAGQVDAELAARGKRACAAAAAARAARPVEGGHEAAGVDSYRFAFDEDGVEWFIADPLGHRILDVSSAAIQYSQMAAAELLTKSLQDLIAFEGITLEQVLQAADRSWHACQRRSRQGADTGQASVRPMFHRGRDAVALVFRTDRADVRAEAALAMLSRLFNIAGSVDIQAATARLLIGELSLDYLALWSARPEENGQPGLLIQHWPDAKVDWPKPQLQTSLRRVLSGKSMIQIDDAKRLAELDPLLQQLGIAGFAGLPLFDERRSVIGALLVGRRLGLGHPDIVEPVLRCAAARFAQGMELRRTREQGRAEALLDTLTRLPNRLLFSDRLDTILREARRTGECFALLFVNLDEFKTVNESHGHAAGDEVLRAIARRLAANVRASDTLARYAGDEFTLVIRHIIRTDDVLRVAEKIGKAMEAPLRLDGGSELQVTASIGVSFFPDDAVDAETLLKHADEAMRAAKRLGHGHFRIYELSPEQVRQHDVALISRLRHAERNGELHVVYQPQVDAVSEDIVGMEALLRWEHPDLGGIGPGVFIPLAEQSGLIVSIGEWVLRTACLQAAEWERRYHLRLRLGVNLSAVQLMQPGLLPMVARTLHETGLDPPLLELEVTESISIKEAPYLVENLRGLHELGCGIAIDDFGTGAASLDYLRRLPADRIKIDQSFVRNIGVDPDDEAIVRATIEMAHRLKRGVVAEGVEIEQHFEFLRANHCDELQGYLFCRPLSETGFERLLDERQRLVDAPVGAAA